MTPTSAPDLDWAQELDPSPAGALRQDITALRRTIGVTRHLRLVVDDLAIGLESLEIVATRVYIDLKLEVVGDQMVAIGTLAADWNGPCRRCLEPVAASVGVDGVREIFQKVPVEGETWPLEEEFADIRPMVTELLMLHLPTAPLCAEDCQGPAPDLFPTSAVASRNDGRSDHGTEADAQAGAHGGDEHRDEHGDEHGDRGPEAPADPRWAALADLTFDSDDESS